MRARSWVWLPLIIGWLPVWALYAMLIVAMHGVSLVGAGIIAGRAVLTAAVLGLVVGPLTRRLPWPRPFRLWFVPLHLALAATFSVAWVTASTLVEYLLAGGSAAVSHQLLVPYLVLGVWLYVMVAGVTYAAGATERAARAEALAARSQLAALRSQLNPHFLFNALHTVVHLIPRQPAQAAEAAEGLAGLLRTTIEEDRDLIPLGEEWALVERYLAIERIRFGDRLRVTARLDDGVRSALVPAFALQTLVENAVRHGAAPRVEPTTIAVAAAPAGRTLTVTVTDDGAGGAPSEGEGTGLRRLRERLAVLYDSGARLELAAPPGGGFTAKLVVPLADAAG